jgi:3-hydroxyisobutyrate dehydrogenase
MTKNIAFLGLGVMGGAIAANLAKADYKVTAWNRTPDRPGIEIARSAGAAIASSIHEAVTGAEVIFTCLGDVPDVEAVVLGDVAGYARLGALVIDTSTIGAVAAQYISAQLGKRGLRFLDAPVSGGDIGARNGTLTIMVGGDRSDFEECKPLFEAIGKNITLCGSVGSGQSVKLCNQVLASAYMVGICEAMLLAEQSGLDPSLVVEVCGSGAAASWALSNLGMKVAKSDFQPGFMIKHILKDLRLVQELAEVNSLPGVELSDRLFKKVKELEGGSEQGTQAMIRAYREIS